MPYRNVSSATSVSTPGLGARAGSETRPSLDMSRHSGRRRSLSAVHESKSCCPVLLRHLLPRQPLLEESSALIVTKYAPWFESSFLRPCQDIPPSPICGSWVLGLSRLAGKSDLDGVLRAAIGALGLLIKEKEVRRFQQAPSYSQAYGDALSLLRNNILRACSTCRTCLVAASMCLILSEVRNRPTSYSVVHN